MSNKNKNIAFITLGYLFLSATIIVTILFSLWPSDTVQKNFTITLPFNIKPYRLPQEVRFLMMASLAGAIGGLIHALRSLFCYYGNAKFKSQWAMMYITLPISGALLGLGVEFLVGTGIISVGSGTSSNNTQGRAFAATAFPFLIGLFSQQAVLKLQEVANTLLTPTKKGKDDYSDDETLILQLKPNALSTKENTPFEIEISINASEKIKEKLLLKAVSLDNSVITSSFMPTALDSANLKSKLTLTLSDIVDGTYEVLVIASNSEVMAQNKLAITIKNQ